MCGRARLGRTSQYAWHHMRTAIQVFESVITSSLPRGGGLLVTQGTEAAGMMGNAEKKKKEKKAA